MQNLALEDMMGVAGNPTTTTPTPRLSISRLKALQQATNASQTTCAQASMSSDYAIRKFRRVVDQQRDDRGVVTAIYDESHLHALCKV